MDEAIVETQMQWCRYVDSRTRKCVRCAQASTPQQHSSHRTDSVAQGVTPHPEDHAPSTALLSDKLRGQISYIDQTVSNLEKQEGAAGVPPGWVADAGV